MVFPNVTSVHQFPPKSRHDPTAKERQDRFRAKRKRDFAEAKEALANAQTAIKQRDRELADLKATLSNAQAEIAKLTKAVANANAAPPAALPTSPTPAPQQHQTLTSGLDNATTGRLKGGGFLRFCTFTAALGLASVSGGFSIVGLTSIFTGAPLAVMAMAGALEAAKLTGVAWAARTPFSLLKVPLLGFIGVLMLVNTIGIYGYLSKSEISQRVAGSAAHLALVAEADSKVANQNQIVEGLDRQISAIFARIDKATQTGRVNAAGDIAQAERTNVTRLQTDRLAQARILGELKTERARLDGQKLVMEGELGPIIYISSLISLSPEMALKLFIFVLSIIIEPGAIVLMAAATKR